MKRFGYVVGVALLVALAAGCSGGAESPKKVGSVSAAIAVHGVVRVPIYPSRAAIANGATDGETCIAKPGYRDVAAGGQVVVRDEAGTTLGVGELDNGTTELINDDVLNSFCRFAFSVADVPSGRRFYSVSVGGAQRGEVQYTAVEISEPITVTIGS